VNEMTSYIRRPAHYGKDMSACGVIGLINTDRQPVDGSVIWRAIANMRDRGNGLGGGFAAYGIYPQFADFYALHIMYDSRAHARDVEEYFDGRLEIHHAEEIPTYKTAVITDHPYFKRYFVSPPTHRPGHQADDDYMVDIVMHVNTNVEHAFIVSSGKNMGVFKGVGFPEDIAEFFRIDQYQGHIWTAHNRFPTNTPGW